MCALDVIHLWNPPSIVIEYLKTGDEKIRAAASDAARAAARAATWAAAQNPLLESMLHRLLRTEA